MSNGCFRQGACIIFQDFLSASILKKLIISSISKVLFFHFTRNESRKSEKITLNNEHTKVELYYKQNVDKDPVTKLRGFG